MTDSAPRPAPATTPPAFDHSSVHGEILGDGPAKKRRPEPTSIVIFGATGDLASASSRPRCTT